MEIRKTLLAFRTLLNSIKSFKTHVIPSRDELDTCDYKEDMQMLTTRYLLLTENREFQERLKELYYLETAMIQIRCINDIKPIFFKSKPSVSDYIYVRGSFLTKGPVYQMARSLGKLEHFKQTPRQMGNDPKMIEKAKIRLRLDMEDQMILEEYKFKYDVANRKDA